MAVTKMGKLGEILESMGFKEGDIPETWNGIMDGIHFGICKHPFKGIAIIYYRVGKRSAVQDEIFIPLDSNKQQIAQTIVRIHEQIYGQ